MANVTKRPKQGFYLPERKDSCFPKKKIRKMKHTRDMTVKHEINTTAVNPHVCFDSDSESESWF